MQFLLKDDVSLVSLNLKLVLLGLQLPLEVFRLTLQALHMIQQHCQEGLEGVRLQSHGATSMMGVQEIS